MLNENPGNLDIDFQENKKPSVEAKIEKVLKSDENVDGSLPYVNSQGVLIQNTKKEMSLLEATELIMIRSPTDDRLKLLPEGPSSVIGESFEKGNAKEAQKRVLGLNAEVDNHVAELNGPDYPNSEVRAEEFLLTRDVDTLSTLWTNYLTEVIVLISHKVTSMRSEPF